MSFLVWFFSIWLKLRLHRSSRPKISTRPVIFWASVDLADRCVQRREQSIDDCNRVPRTEVHLGHALGPVAPEPAAAAPGSAAAFFSSGLGAGMWTTSSIVRGWARECPTNPVTPGVCRTPTVVGVVHAHQHVAGELVARDRLLLALFDLPTSSVGTSTWKM